jgi:hypothetical protein
MMGKVGGLDGGWTHKTLVAQASVRPTRPTLPLFIIKIIKRTEKGRGRSWLSDFYFCSDFDKKVGKVG